MKILFILVTTLMISGCSLWQTKESTVINEPTELRLARVFFNNRNYERAEDEVKRYFDANKDVYYYGQAYLLLGEIRETSGQEARALEAYKQAVKYGAGYHSTVVSQALYRQSWVLEREARYEDMLVVLQDLDRSLGNGDNYIKRIETPARIANVYYVLGYWDKAVALRDKITPSMLAANKHLAKSETDLFQTQLYLLFLALKPTPQTPQKSREILALSQRTLLEVGEMAEKKAAESALHGIENEYRRYYRIITKRQKPKSQTELVQNDRKTLEQVSSFVDMLEELKGARRPPELVANQRMTLDFFKRMDALKQEARDYAHDLQTGMQKARAEKPAKDSRVKKGLQ